MAVTETAQQGGADPSRLGGIAIGVALGAATLVAVPLVDTDGSRGAVVKAEGALVHVGVEEADGVAEAGLAETLRLAEIDVARPAVTLGLFVDIVAGRIEGTVVDILAVVDGTDGAGQGTVGGGIHIGRNTLAPGRTLINWGGNEWF